ncbi:periplasmic heavy metal sensor [bacterium]|nr:periplasmic heavy metal sensor [bacterium]
MKMKQIQKSIMIAVIALVMAAPAAMARPMGGGAGGPGARSEMMAGGPSGMISQLNLTKEQIDLLKKEKLKKRKTMIQQHSTLELLQIDLAEEVGRDNPNMGKIEKMAKKIGDIHGQMTAERVKSIIYLRSILTDEQKQIMEVQQLHFEGMGGHKGTKGKPGRGKHR